MKPRKTLFFTLMAVIFAAWMTAPTWVTWWSGSKENIGTFGDLFGTLNALFSGLAFLGVLAALILQQEALSTDRFEGRFYRQMEGLRDLISTFNLNYRTAEFSGKKVFSHLINELINQLNVREITPPTKDHLKSISDYISMDWDEYNESEQPIKVYHEFFHFHESELGPYFRTLYNILSMIDRSSIKDKNEYTDMFRAELSWHELFLIGLNCLTERGSKMKPLVEKYGILKHIPQGRHPLGREWFVERFSPHAFETPCHCHNL